MKWWSEKAWPWLRDMAWPGVISAYANHEGVRHLVTLAFGLFVGAVLL